MNRKMLLVALGALIVMSLLARPEHAAANAQKIATVAGASASASGIGKVLTLAAPATGPGAPYVLGAATGAYVAEGIGGIACVVFALFDPPDPTNAGVPVQLSDHFIPYPSVASRFPGIDSATASLGDAYFQTQADILGNWRARNVAIDRFEGALLLGNSSFASDRLREINAFTAGIDQGYRSAAPALTSFVSAVDTHVPNVLDSSIGKQEITQEIVLNAGGTVQPEEKTALEPFNVTPQEYGVLQNHFAQVADPAGAVNVYFSSLGLGNAGSITARQALTSGYGLLCQECQAIPEPAGVLLFGTGLAGLLGYASWRRDRAAVYKPCL